MSEAGIEDAHFSNIMVENFDNPGGLWLEIGQGRVTIYEDGLAQRQ